MATALLGLCLAVFATHVDVEVGAGDPAALKRLETAANDCRETERELRVRSSRSVLVVADEPKDPEARVVYEGNRAILEINGERMEPNFNLDWSNCPQGDAFDAKIFDLGVKISECGLWVSRGVERDDGSYDFSKLDKAARDLVMRLPGTKIYMGVWLDFPKWCANHPDECIGYADGPAEKESDEHHGRPIRPSAASKAFRAEVARFLAALGAYVRAQPWGREVVMVRPAWGIYCEWHYWGMYHFPDTGKAMTEAFHAFDGGKWANAAVPTVAERIAGGGALDPAKDAKTIAYYRCMAETTSDFLLFCCRETKRAFPGRLVGAYYGYVMAPHPPEGATVLLDKVLASPDVDFLASPSMYTVGSRRAGGSYYSRTVPATFRRYGKLAIIEDDMRFHHIRPFCQGSDSERLICTETPRESRMTMRRDYLNRLFDGTGLQFNDPKSDSFGKRPHAFDDPDVLLGLREAMDVVRRVGRTEAFSGNELAVVVDPLERLARSAKPSSDYRHGRVFVMQEFARRTGVPFDLLTEADWTVWKDRYRKVIHLRDLTNDVPYSVAEWRALFDRMGVKALARPGTYVRRQGNLVLYHCADAGWQTLDVPDDLRGCRAEELFSGNVFSGDRIEFTTDGCDTRLFRFKQNPDGGLFALVAHGVPVAEIVRTGDATVDADIAFFTNAVFRCTGASLPVVTKRTAGGRAIEFELVPGEPLTEDDWQVTFPDARTMKVRGTAAWSCRWALNEILEKDAGVVFVLPGAHGTHYPRTRNLAVPTRERQGASSFRLQRHLWRENLEYARSLGAKRQPCSTGSYVQHGFWKLFPLDKYGEGEWREKLMPQINGVRRRPRIHNLGWQPCLSHPESVSEAVRCAIDYLKKHPNDTGIPLGANDLGGWCECEGCRKMNVGFEKRSTFKPEYVSHSLSFWKWVNAVTEELVKVYPNVLVGASAYMYVTDPPPFKLNEHITVGICMDMMQTRDPERKAMFDRLIAEWSKKAAHIGLDGYDYGSTEYLIPRVYNRLLVDHVCGNKRKYPSANYVFAEGEGDCISGEGPKRYVYYKAMFDPHFDLESALARWYEACCGREAAPFLRAYYEQAEAFWAGEAVKKTSWYRGSVRRDYFNFDDQNYVTALKPEELARAGELMDRAVSAAKAHGDGEQRARAERLWVFHQYFAHRLRSYCYDVPVPQTAKAAETFFAQLPQYAEEARQAFSFADRILAANGGRTKENPRGRTAEVSGMRNEFRVRAYEEVNPLLKTRIMAAADFLGDEPVRAALKRALDDRRMMPGIGDFVRRIERVGALPNLITPNSVERFEKERRYRVQGIRPGSELGIRVRIANRDKKTHKFWLYFAPTLPSNGSLYGHCARDGVVLPAGATREFLLFGHVTDSFVWAGVKEGAVGVYDHGDGFSDEAVTVESVYACDFNGR